MGVSLLDHSTNQRYPNANLYTPSKSLSLWAQLILFFLVLLVTISICIDTLRLGISPMPTSKKVRRVVLATVGKGKVYELGSGWGTLAIELSRKNEVIALEKAWVPWFFSKFNNVLRGGTVKIQRQNIYSLKYTDADVVFCYLYPGAMRKLAPKFGKELKTGAIVFSNTFQIPGRNPSEVLEINDWFRTKVYVYHY